MSPSLRKQHVIHGVQANIVRFVPISIMFLTTMSYLVAMITKQLKWGLKMLALGLIRIQIQKMKKLELLVAAKKKDATVIV